MAGARGAARGKLVGRRFRRRNRARRTRRLPRVPWRTLRVVVSLVALALAVPPALRAARRHPYFAVRDVVIHHHGRLAAADLRAAFGFGPGDNIWTIDLGAAEARLRGLTWVRAASVRRELPDRVVVRVREYRPAAIVAVDDQPPALFYVAANGRIFAPVGATDGRDLPYITGLTRADLDGREGFGPRAVHRALGLLRLVGREPGGIGPVSEVNVSSDRGMTLLPVRPPIPIALGWGGLPRKLDRLGRVLPLWAGRAADVREVSCIFDDQVIVRMRAPMAPETPQRGGAPDRRKKRAAGA
jgi:cell division protein FtsQ